jgi:hypothetical protein
MISEIDAMSIALKHLNENRRSSSCDLVISHVRERPKSWLVFFDSRDFIENGNHLAALIGGIPTVVSKATGEVAPAFYAAWWEDAVRQAEAALGIFPEQLDDRAN